MPELSDTLSINLRFGTWTLPITIPRSEEIFYREAERLIKERYNFYTSSYKNQSTELYLVMTLVDVAVKLQKQQDAMDAQPLISRLEPMLKELESALKSEEQ